MQLQPRGKTSAGPSPVQHVFSRFCLAFANGGLLGTGMGVEVVQC